MREAVATENTENLEVESSPWSKTGYKNIIQVGGKYQARLQIPGDGRGGTTKRKQHSLAGLFDTPLEAAISLAVIKRDMMATYGKLVVPPKQIEVRKPRRKSAQPAMATPVPQMPVPVATTVAVPMLYPMLDMPTATATPVPMQPLCDLPPF